MPEGPIPERLLARSLQFGRRILAKKAQCIEKQVGRIFYLDRLRQRLFRQFLAGWVCDDRQVTVARPGEAE